MKTALIALLVISAILTLGVALYATYRVKRWSESWKIDDDEEGR